MLKNEWAVKAARRLKAELKIANVSYAELAGRLSLVGFPHTAAGVAQKLNGRDFAVSFLFAVCEVVGLKLLRIDD